VLEADCVAAAEIDEKGARPLFVPHCPVCRQTGREHAREQPEPGRHFICVVCNTRWTRQAPES
jgi:hypothetical protein